MRTLLLTGILLLSIVATSTASYSAIRAEIYRKSQTMKVWVNGVHKYTWSVSTGQGYGWTKPGTFRPQFFSKHHRSSIYNNAPMPYSVFFSGNIAIHGTNQVKKLGQRASKGCVRLRVSDARTFFNLAYRNKGRTKIVVY